MATTHLNFGIVWIFVHFVATLADDYGTSSGHAPAFLTSSQVLKVVEHETVILPCEVTNLGEYILAWKRGIAVLSAGPVRVVPNQRVKLVNGYNLEIRDAQRQDAGDYTCQIGTIEPREITHSLEILAPAQIDYVTNGGKMEAKKGTTVTLECRASGNPEPVITWTRKNNLLPNGDKSRASPSLILAGVDRHQAGTYECAASNGIGQPAVQQIYLHILYPPEITVERPVVYSGDQLEAHLVCTVYGENKPQVLWYRDTMQLDTTERRIMEAHGHRHTLIIRKVTQADFGNYTCVADNQLGKARKSIELTGKPNQAIIRSPALGQWRDRFNLSWVVETHAPLEEIKVFYRKLPDQLEQEQLQPLQHQSQQRKYLKKEMYGLTNTYRGGVGEWHDVIVPGGGYQPTTNYLIQNLEPHTLYEAKVLARNRYGWSPVSQSFTFQTTTTDNVIEEMDILTSYDISVSVRMTSSCFVIIIIMASVAARGLERLINSL